jgi:hypothetical protein
MSPARKKAKHASKQQLQQQQQQEDAAAGGVGWQLVQQSLGEEAGE